MALSGGWSGCVCDAADFKVVALLCHNHTQSRGHSKASEFQVERLRRHTRPQHIVIQRLIEGCIVCPPCTITTVANEQTNKQTNKRTNEQTNKHSSRFVRHAG